MKSIINIMKKISTREWIAVSVALITVIIFFSIGFYGVPSTSNIPLGSSAGDISLDEVVSTGSLAGLVIQDIVAGDGTEAQFGDVVTLYYTGRLDDGTIFDSIVEGQEPFTFTLGTGSVIAGWDQGVSGMRVGGRRILIIPPELGYGAEGIGPIPRNATLIFEVELLGVADRE